MEKLEYTIKNYDWGKIGDEGVVAKLYGGKIDPTMKYAELWMGTHTNGESVVKSKGITLSAYVDSNAELLAPHENGHLNFLFKVLSVRKSLSIQIHPTKEQAKELHSKDPKNYPDDNHKPEMSIALSDFEILCGFRLANEIVGNFVAIPELSEYANEDILKGLAENKETALKQLFISVWKSPSERISNTVDKVIKRLSQKINRSEMENLIIRLDKQFPGGDVGILAPFFMNYFTLRSGEATFIGPNIPHAYLSGDCVECMATSDNTIRAGLTPKFKDVATLCRNLTYEMSTPPYFKPNILSPGIIEYAPTVSEFAVHKITSAASALDHVSASSILIVISGTATLKDEVAELNLCKGDAIFIPYPCTSLQLSELSEEFLSFRAFTPKKP